MAEITNREIFNVLRKIQCALKETASTVSYPVLNKVCTLDTPTGIGYIALQNVDGVITTLYFDDELNSVPSLTVIPCEVNAEIETELLCVKNSDDIVIRRIERIGATETVTYTYLDDTPYTGLLSDLGSCGCTSKATEVGLFHATDGTTCVELTKYSLIDCSDNIVAVWFEEVGSTAEYVLPVGWTIYSGACCASSVSWAYGNDLSTLSAGNSFAISKPSCCNLILETSIGSIPMIGELVFMSTETFSCPVTIDSITVLGTCDLSKVIITSNLI